MLISSKTPIALSLVISLLGVAFWLGSVAMELEEVRADTDQLASYHLRTDTLIERRLARIEAMLEYLVKQEKEDN